jgi:putative peptidoglycan lipid II flippase
MKTPMRIAIAVLIGTQILNYFLVPLLQHAALTLSISIGALVNALWLLIGLMRQGSFKPLPGWLKFIAQVFVASAVLGFALYYLAQGLPWIEWHTLPHGQWLRIGALTGIIVSSGLVYFAMLAGMGLKLKSLLHA